MKTKFQGVYTALVTPFSSDGGCVDVKSLRQLLEFQCASDVTGFIVCGSTGEAATLSDSEYVEVVTQVRELAGDRPVIAGVSVSATARAVEMARVIEELRCDGILLAAPPYNKPNQAGLIEHFAHVAAATSLPIVAYNIPSRSGVSIQPGTLGELSRRGLIAAIKESSGSLDTFLDVKLAVSEDCNLLTGEDSMFSGALACGGCGIVSASANVIPDDFCCVWRAWEQGDSRLAVRTQLEMTSKIRHMFIETNPVPAKTVLAKMGVINSAAVRLPLVPLSDENRIRVCEAFK